MTEGVQSTFIEAGRILVLATALGIAYNAVSPHGVPLVRTAGISPAIGASSVPLVIDAGEAQHLFQKGEAVFLDARGDEDFMLGHIEGAISLPLSEFENKIQRISSIPKDALLITYCGGEDCASSTDLAHKLASLGYTNVKIFFAGWGEWMQRNLPIETGPSPR